MADPRSRTVDQTPRLKIELGVYDHLLAFTRQRARAKFSYEIVAEVLELHGPSENLLGRIVCEGCEWDGHDAEAPEWPCVTHRRIAAKLLGAPYQDRIDQMLTARQRRGDHATVEDVLGDVVRAVIRHGGEPR